MKLAALAALVAALVVAGCGGDGGSSEEAEAWAGEICSSIATWQGEVETISQEAADAITEPGATRSDIEDAVQGGLDATKTLLEELRASVPPDTAEADAAQAAVDAFVDDVRAANDEVASAFASLPESAGLPQVVAALSGLGTTLQQTIDGGRELVTELTALGGDIKDGFENADSCQELREPER